MKILFCIRHEMYLRNYDGVIAALCAEGHEVELLFSSLGRSFDRSHLGRLLRENPRLSTGQTLVRRGWWWPLTDAARWVRDHQRYAGPHYRDKIKLVQRVRQRVPSSVRLALETSALLRPAWARALLIRACALFDRITPADPGCLEKLVQSKADLLVVTPLVDFNRPQTDMIKAARELGIPSVLAVASWDNLTNKGLIHIAPDRTLVWNDIQRREAVTMHGLRPDRVVATGAQIFDGWFDREPSQNREAFLRNLGFADLGAPLFVYFCSSSFIASDEAAHVQEWLSGLRASADPRLSRANVIVRPHPANPRPWRATTLRDPLGPGHCRVWPRDAPPPIDDDDKADYINTLSHADLAVGVNTSAFLEAAIKGCPCLAFLPRMDVDDRATLHFQYLVDGGLVTVAHALEDHLEQLVDTLENRAERLAQVRAFVHQFLRPRGLDKPATPIVLAALLDARITEPPRRRPAQTLSQVARWLMAPPLAPIRARLLEEMETAGPLGREWPRIRVHAAPVGRSATLLARKVEGAVKSTHKRLDRFGSSETTILVGPWLGEVGYELLYWIPFVRWVQNTHAIPAHRMVIVTRGGAHVWYKDISPRRVDLLDLMRPEEFKALVGARQRVEGVQKQRSLSPIDKEVIERVRVHLGLDRVQTLTPDLMFQGAIRYNWSNRAAVNTLWRHTQHRPLPRPAPGPLEESLPASYIVAGFYSRESFPDHPAVRAFTRRMLRHLLTQDNVIVLNKGIDLDDHLALTDPSVADGGTHRMIDASQWMRPSTNLEVQTRLIAGARAFVGTYGGLSYLAPMLGVPTIAFYQEGWEVNDAHLDLASTLFRDWNAPYQVLGMAEADSLSETLRESRSQGPDAGEHPRRPFIAAIPAD